MATPESAARAAARFPGHVGKQPWLAQADVLRVLEGEARRRAQGGQARASARALIIQGTDDPPVLTVAGLQQVTRAGLAGELFWGSEFGGGGRPRTHQFPPYNPGGYWLTPAVRAVEGSLDEAAARAVREAWAQLVRRAG